MKMEMSSNPIIDLKEAVDQALRVRASRDFATRAAYEHSLENRIQQPNQTRAEKFSAEKATLRPVLATWDIKFTKSESRASTIALISHLAFMKSCTGG